MLPVWLGNVLVEVNLIVCHILEAPTILGANYCHKFVEEIRPKIRLVELDDVSTVPIDRRPPIIDPRAPPYDLYCSTTSKINVNNQS